jgi:PIN domain nuclease of toxin-antitoxin system
MMLVMDASALTALFREERGADIVEQLVHNNDCCMHVVNLCEIYYGFRREAGQVEADRAVDDVESLAVAVRGDLDTEFWKQVGAYKADVGGLSLADCFCLALATRVTGEIVTTDHEFDAAAERNLCPVRFIR